MVHVVGNEIVAERSGHHPDTTNNRMELTALLEALDVIPEGTAVTVYSDSHLAIQTITEWAAGWEKRGWKRKSGPVENLDLSLRRAQAAFDYLIDRGQDPERFEVKGYGEDVPLVSNDTAEGRARNRRIEFKALLEE